MKIFSSLALAASLALGTAIAMAPLAPAMASTTKAAPAKTSMTAKCTPSKDKKCPVHHKVVKHHKKTPVTKTSAKKAPVKAATDKTPVKPAAN